jgi:hypothetical protein
MSERDSDLCALLFKNSCVWPQRGWHGFRASRPGTTPKSPADLFEQEITTRHRPGAARLGDAVNQIKNLRHAEPKW